MLRLIDEKETVREGRRKQLASFAHLSSDDKDWVLEKVVKRVERHSKEGIKDKDIGGGEEEDEEDTTEESEAKEENEDDDNNDQVIDVDIILAEPVTEECVKDFDFNKDKAMDGEFGDDENDVVGAVDDSIQNLFDTFCNHLQQWMVVSRKRIQLCRIGLS